MDESEKRHRYRVPFFISVIWEAEGQATTYPVSKDISTEGIFLITDKTLPVGTRGHIKIQLESGTEKIEIDAQCEVLRTVNKPSLNNPAGIGLKFIDLDPDSSIHLYNIMRYQVGGDPVLETSTD